MLKNQKGITLVALVVTIVVLIILATISINLAMNTNIIGEAEKAASWQANADKSFEDQDANMAAYVQQYVANATATE